MLHSAVIEVRQHLSCANVFIQFEKFLSDLESLKIVVGENNVKLKNSKYDAELSVNNHFSILAGTFSNLIIDAENASFRISIKDIQIPSNEENGKRDYVQINLTEKDEASVTCSNCDSILVTPRKYNKIREFPSGTIDVSDFFCHHGTSFQDTLVPSISDLFYGFYFVVLNRDTIETFTRHKENHIYCKRCLRYLGEYMFNGKAAKLWSESIHFNLDGQVLEIFASDERCQIHKLMLKAIDATSLPPSEPLLRNMHFTKVLLKASFPDRQQQYLLVHILEKNLLILRNKEIELSEGFHSTHEFKQSKAFKILYRWIGKIEDSNENKTFSWPPILEYWQRDINILKMIVSPFLFCALNKELNKNAKVLPEIHRVNNDDFTISYIFY